MRAIETKANVSPDGLMTLNVPGDIAPGEHQVIVVLEEQAERGSLRLPLDFPVVDLGPWPEGLSLSREDMYDNEV